MCRELIVLIGNIGEGKTTIAQDYVKGGYVAIARDTLRYGIGDGQYIFNPEYEPIIWATELYMFKRFLELGCNILVDEVGITKSMRARYISKAKKKGYKIIVIEMPRLTMNEAVDRRMQNPHNQPERKLWEQIWTRFDAVYEEPTKDEGIDIIIRLKGDQ